MAFVGINNELWIELSEAYGASPFFQAPNLLLEIYKSMESLFSSF